MTRTFNDASFLSADRITDALIDALGSDWSLDHEFTYLDKTVYA